MRYPIKALFCILVLFSFSVCANEVKHLHIVGGGMLGVMQAYHEYKLAEESGQKLRITIYEKHRKLSDTTVANLVPSLTPDEILAVVPPADQFVDKLAKRFDDQGGIRVNDVPNVNDGQVMHDFLHAVTEFNKDEAAQYKRTQSLLNLGNMSMSLWEEIYQHADPEFKQIMLASNYNPCRELTSKNLVLHDGYRIDLIFDFPHAIKKAEGMVKTYIDLGYSSSRVLSPEQVLKIDPSLQEFVVSHSYLQSGSRVWQDDAVALYRPGGCLDTGVFLPKIYAYLAEKMGTYDNQAGVKKFAFEVLYDHEIAKVLYAPDQTQIIGLVTSTDQVILPSVGADVHYVFCPGESVGALKSLGFMVPAYSGFAGPSLLMNIPLDNVRNIPEINNYMEVHKEGVVLAWQARNKDDKLFIGAAGTNAYYADQTPHINQAFAKERNLLQLNVINNVYPTLIKNVFAELGVDVNNGQTLTDKHLSALENAGIAKRWVGVRAVAYDQYPTVGSLYTTQGNRIINASVVTHAGSGGGSCAPILVYLNSLLMRNDFDGLPSQQLQEAAYYARSNRTPEIN